MQPVVVGRLIHNMALLAVAIVLCCCTISCKSAQATGVTGNWHYHGASVEAKSATMLARVAKPVAKSKIKSKLEKAYKKVKLTKSGSRLTLNADGTFAMRLIGPEIKGKYDYDASTERLTLRWHGLSLSARAKRDGKQLHLLFDTQQLLRLMELASGLSSNKTLQALAFLSENYDDVQVGIAFKQ